MKDKRTGKTGVEFLIGCHDFLLDKDETWEIGGQKTGEIDGLSHTGT